MEIKPRTKVRESVEDTLLEHIRKSQDFKLLVKAIIQESRNPQNVEIRFMLQSKEIKEKPEFYTDSDGTKCYGIPQGTVKMNLHEETKDKLYGLAVETKEDKKRK
jgi:hypothetical protein